MKTVPEVLLEAAKLVRRGWCQGELARDYYGKPVGCTSPSACAWCLDGAVSRAVCDALDDRLWSPAWSAVKKALGVKKPIDWNDTPGRTAEEVAQKLEEAASLATKGSK